METNQDIRQEDTTIRNVCLFSNLGSEYMNTKTKIKKGKSLITTFEVQKNLHINDWHNKYIKTQ